MQIGLATQDPRSHFWLIVNHAARARATELGIEISIQPSYTLDEQIAVIDRFAQQRVDALIVGPYVSVGLGQAVERAQAVGIPVISMVTDLHDCTVRCTVRSDNGAGAELAAMHLAERIGGEGEVAHLTGPSRFQDAIERARGFRRVLDHHPGIRVVFEQEGATWNRETGEALMREALARHPSIRAVCAANDPFALGAVDVIAEAGLAREIVVTGFDATPDALVAIHQGHMSATVRQSIREIGRTSVEVAQRAASGEAVPALILTEIALVTKANLIDAALDTMHLFPGVLHDLVDSGEALAKERALLRTVIDAFPDTHVFVKDRASRFIIANAASLTTLGAARLEDVVGRSDLDLFPQELAAQYYADEQAVMESGQALYDRIEPVVDQSGNQKWYLTTKLPMRDPSGAVVGLIGMSRDITMIRQAEEERERLREDVIRIQEIALRELSTPLIPISDEVMVMPLIGTLDSRRIQQIMETLLHGIAASHARIAILDITGVPVVDTHVASALVQAAQAVKLLGAQVVLSGIHPEVAQTLVGLGVDLSGIVTSGTLENGITYALNRRR
jgi:PAS domain S-box-containing protein